MVPSKENRATTLAEPDLLALSGTRFAKLSLCDGLDRTGMRKSGSLEKKCGDRGPDSGPRSEPRE